jgi:homocysteine S-methyltransferase
MGLLEKEVLLLDGGLGTTLEDEHGIKFDTHTPLWSSHTLISGTSTLRTVQQDFARAGADIILTATYQTSFPGFANTKTMYKDGIDKDEAKRLMLSAVKIAREAFHSRAGLVALGLGAYGATMVPSTEYSGAYGRMEEDDLYEFHQERINVFVESPEWKDVDLVAFETLPRVDEVRATRRVMQNVRDKDYWISCVFPNDDARLPDGTDIERLVRTMLEGESPPFAIGINCTKVHKISTLIVQFERAAKSQGFSLPRLALYPDGAGGKVYDTKLQQWIGDGQDEVPWDKQVFDIVNEVRARSAWKGIIVGGCCKTSPQNIGKLKTQLDGLKP